MIDCEDAEPEVRVGAVGRAGSTWNARETGDAAAYWSSPTCDAVTSQVPTAEIVTTPSVDTVHAEFVVPLPNENATSSVDEAVAVKATLDEPNATADG